MKKTPNLSSNNLSKVKKEVEKRHEMFITEVKACKIRLQYEVAIACSTMKSSEKQKFSGN